jgi:hypothetical protein
MPVPLALTWSHLGVPYRVTPWPEVRFERLYGDEWVELSPTEDALASAAQTCGAPAWRAYLEFVPRDVRELLGAFRFARMEALQIAARCPGLVADLTDTPALVAFLAAHASLRGTGGACWNEINAIHERAGIFGVMEWLGLPASRQTLGILRNLSEPDVPKRLLERLRAMLWEPRTIFLLQKLGPISDRDLAGWGSPLAA